MAESIAGEFPRTIFDSVICPMIMTSIRGKEGIGKAHWVTHDLGASYGRLGSHTRLNWFTMTLAPSQNRDFV